MRKAIWTAVAAALLVAGTDAGADPFPGVVSHSYYVAVRDGTKLAVSVYDPATDGKVAAGRHWPAFPHGSHRKRASRTKRRSTDRSRRSCRLSRWAFSSREPSRSIAQAGHSRGTPRSTTGGNWKLPGRRNSSGGPIGRRGSTSTRTSPHWRKLLGSRQRPPRSTTWPGITSRPAARKCRSWRSRRSATPSPRRRCSKAMRRLLRRR